MLLSWFTFLVVARFDRFRVPGFIPAIAFVALDPLRSIGCRVAAVWLSLHSLSRSIYSISTSRSCANCVVLSSCNQCVGIANGDSVRRGSRFQERTGLAANLPIQLRSRIQG